MSDKVISVVGKSNVGKTTLIEKMIPFFSARGITIGTIKHHLHELELDAPGKDSWRHRKAGAVQTVLATPGKFALFSDCDGEQTIDSLLRYFDRADIVITDGFKGGNRPKIEVFRPSHYRPPILGAGSGLVAYATDAPDYPFEMAVPVLDLNVPETVVEFIMDYFGILR